MKRLKSTRLFSLLLTVCVMLSVLPVTAYASYSFVVLSHNGNFGTATVGYAEQTAAEFSLSFYGVTETITGLSASLANGSNFEITEPLSLNTITSDSNTATISVRPKAGLTEGNYTDTLLFSANGMSSIAYAPLNFRVSRYTYSCTVSPSSATFTSAFWGYDNATLARVFTVSNTGTGRLTGLTASLKEGASSDFEISTALSSDSMDAGGTATVGIRPKAGLSVGSHTDTLQITGDDGAAAAVSLSFTVLFDPCIISSPGNQSISAGGNASFTVLAEGTSPLSYQWYESSNGSSWQSLSDGGIYSGTAASTLTLTGVTTAYSGYQYFCEVSNNSLFGARSTEAQLTVTGGGTGALTGTMSVGGRSVNLNSDANYTGWIWDAAAATLTLDGNYTGEAISVQCGANSDINLVLTGDVRIDTSSMAIGLYGISSSDTSRRLIIKAGSQTLTLISGQWDAVGVQGDITIESGTVVAVGYGHGISANGDVAVTGSANLTATGGSWGSGIQAGGAILINTTGRVEATGGFCGLRPINGGITISSGTVSANGGTYEALSGGENDAGVNITGGTVETGGTNGNVSGRLNVSGAVTGVKINGKIDGSLTVSNGTVTVTGTVAGSRNLTGGTVWVNGAKVYPVGSGDNDTSTRGGASSAPAPTISGSTATTTVIPTVKDGAATASVTSAQVTSAIEAAKTAATKTGEKPELEIALSGASGASKTTASIPKSSVASLVTGGIDALTITSSVATVSFDAAALSTINSASTGDVSVTAAKVAASTLPAVAQTLVGDRPVYNFSVTSGGKTISSFGGTVTVSIPYTPASGEDTDNLVVYYISDSGSVERIENARYDAAAGAMVFTTTHFNSYAVGYVESEEEQPLFSDVQPGAWYYDAVNFLKEKGITTGTSATTYSPDATLTRGQFITLLLRAYDIAADENLTDNFSDAGETYYTGYLAAAKRLGISSGVGDNKFAPEQAISRQQMFTLLYNALKVLDQLPEGDSGKTLSDFSDNESIASYAQEAVAYLVETGVVGGNNGALLPEATTTRAQMAQVLYSLMSK